MIVGPEESRSPAVATTVIKHEGGPPWPSERAAFYALFAAIIATSVIFIDHTVFSLLSEKIKLSFGMSDFALGVLLGPASIVIYVIIGIPLAHLVDTCRRKYVLSGGIASLGAVIVLGGFAQSLSAFVFTRLFVGASSSVNAPGSYSVVVDYFRSSRLPLAFSLLQLGFISGTSLGNMVGSALISWTERLGHKISVAGFEIFNWQLVLIIVGIPGLLASLLWLTVEEPVRRNTSAERQISPSAMSAKQRLYAFIGVDAAIVIWQRKYVFVPIFVALAISAVESQGLPQFRVSFMLRTYPGWDEARLGNILGPVLLLAMLSGVLVGGAFVTRLAKRYKDAEIRATAIIFTCSTIVTIAMPLMPTSELALLMIALTSFLSLAGAAAQNTAIQKIAPGEMRGQVTAFYLFMYTFFGALGPAVIGGTSTFIVGNEGKMWASMLITACVFMPPATLLMWLAIKPYRHEVERLSSLIVR
jgi:MFS family permease